jgi:hypothetical protein
MRSIILLLLPAMSVCARADVVVTTWTGWFSDEACATARANSGVYTATNPDCARKCIEKGGAVVFIAEQEGAIYIVKNYAGSKAIWGTRSRLLARWTRRLDLSL